VAVEYFSKWVEAKPLLSITSATIQKFFWQNIVCHFGVPHEVTVDNDKQFDSTDFKEFCTFLGPSCASLRSTTRNPMGRWSGQTESSSPALKGTSLIYPRASGPKSYRG
jgi:hypothetical protein